MEKETAKCLVCEVSSDELPLVMLQYRDEKYWICSQHLPTLIHQPGTLVGKLPGAEKLKPHEH